MKDGNSTLAPLQAAAEAAATTKRVKDPELIAMHQITEILADLDPEAQGRVMRWMSDRYYTESPRTPQL